MSYEGVFCEYFMGYWPFYHRDGTFHRARCCVSRQHLLLLVCVHHYSFGMQQLSVGYNSHMTATYWGLSSIVHILQMLFPMHFLDKINSNWAFQLTVRQHWLRSWFSAEQAASYYMNQWWLSSPKLICIRSSLRLHHVKYWFHLHGWKMPDWLCPNKIIFCR